MNPLFEVISVRVAPEVTVEEMLPSALLRKGEATSVETPTGTTPAAALWVVDPLLRSILESVRVTPAPMFRDTVKTASRAPSGDSPPAAVPTRSVITPAKFNDVLPVAGGNDEVRRTVTKAAALRFPATSTATRESVSSIFPATLVLN